MFNSEIINNAAISENVQIVDNSKRAKNLILVFWILIGFNVVAIFSGYFEVRLLQDVQEGFFITDDEASANDLRQATIGIIQTAIFITSVVFFLNWFRRAYGNVIRLGVSTKHKESMAVWAWFIPFVSLFWPVQIMNEIWEVTQNKIRKLDTSYISQHSSWLIGLWWTLFIISNILGRYILKNVFADETLEQIIEGSQAMVVSDILQIIEALIVILIVTKLSKIEAKLAIEISNSGGQVLQK